MSKAGNFLIILLLCFVTCAGYAQSAAQGEAQLYFNEGVSAQQSGDADGAYTLYQKTIYINPAYKKFVLNNWGVYWAEEGDYAQAELFLKQAVDLDPRYVLAINNLSLVYMKLSQFHERKKDIHEAFRYLKLASDLFSSQQFALEPEKIQED